MALKIIKSNADNAYRGYRPHWYGVYRDAGTFKTFNLGVLIRGEPPASGYLGDRGDDIFEASRARAEEKFNRIRTSGRDKGEAVREVETIVRMKTGRRFKDFNLVDLADTYLKRIGERSNRETDTLAGDSHLKNLGRFGRRNIGGRSTCHLAMIRSCFKHFADFAANPTTPGVKRARTLLEVTPELATAFFRHVADDFAFSTVKRWSNLLTGTWGRLMPNSVENPFKGARIDALGRVQTYRDEKTGEKVRVETVIHHRPIDREQLRRLYAAAKDDALLYPLVVTAASTGLRISDCCTLLWKDIHLTPANPHIMVETTAKTGAKIAVPIFDYRPGSPDYEPDLGELRRVLEAALAETGDAERYVFPKAARLYLTTTQGPKGVYYPGRDAIYSAGKRLFAKALFADEPEDAETVEDRPKPTSGDILEAIDATRWSAERKRRVKDIYTRHANGESYLAIRAATGYAKSTISTDLAEIERLVGVKTRTSSTRGPSMRDLLKKTRQGRSAGRRGASLYSWHSLRGSFVVMMKDNGVPLDTIRLLVGHTTTDMTLEYYQPTERIAAETARRIVLQRNLAQAALDGTGTRRALTAATLPAPSADAPQANLEALREALARLTPEEREQLLSPTK